MIIFFIIFQNFFHFRRNTFFHKQFFLHQSPSIYTDRDTNREVVLAHVKGHYKEANIPIDEPSGHNSAAVSLNANEFNNNVYVNGILSALTANNGKLLLQAQQQQQQLQQQHHHHQNDQTLPQIRIQTLNQLSGNPSLFLADLKQQQHQQVQPLTISSITQNASNQSLQTANTIQNMNNSITSSTTTTTSINSTTTNSTTNENGGEMDDTSSGLNSVNGWRGTAPYRCGHCHQVSNWKHVIQVYFTNTPPSLQIKTQTIHSNHSGIISSPLHFILIHSLFLFSLHVFPHHLVQF